MISFQLKRATRFHCNRVTLRHIRSIPHIILHPSDGRYVFEVHVFICINLADLQDLTRLLDSEISHYTGYLLADL